VSRLRPGYPNRLVLQADHLRRREEWDADRPEEVFGPVLSVIRFKDEDDAVRIANDTQFGLAAGIWTQSMRRALTMANRVRAGTVWVNNYRSTSTTSPFGGFKMSGIGREGGMAGIKEYMETKSVWISTATDIPNPFIRPLRPRIVIASVAIQRRQGSTSPGLLRRFRSLQ